MIRASTCPRPWLLDLHYLSWKPGLRIETPGGGQLWLSRPIHLHSCLDLIGCDRCFSRPCPKGPERVSYSLSCQPHRDSRLGCHSCSKRCRLAWSACRASCHRVTAHLWACALPTARPTMLRILIQGGPQEQCTQTVHRRPLWEPPLLSPPKRAANPWAGQNLRASSGHHPRLPSCPPDKCY